MDKEYLYQCRGCQEPDKEYPNKEIECDECQGEDCGTYVNDEGDCWKCNGYGVYMPFMSIGCHQWARTDIYGIYTGLYCDDCYDDPHKYTYRKDEYYDPAYAGERMEPDE